MPAACAAQPDSLVTPMGEVCRLLALVAGRVPPGLEEVVLRVRKRLLALLIEPRPCITDSLE